jgi:DNA-binding MarR family transcriptional regulator
MTKDDPLRLDAQLCFAVYSAAHAFTAAYKPLLKSFGLTYPQYLVLLVLWEKDGLSVKEIGTRLRLDSGTVTPLLKRLQAAGLITRERDPKDERNLRVELTEAGRTLRQRIGGAREAIVCALGGSEDNIQDLRRALAEIVPALEGGSARR